MKRTEKGRFLADYLRTLEDDSLMIAARFFSGIIFPRHSMQTVRVGGSMLWDAIAVLAAADEKAMHDSYMRHGDGGDVAGELLGGRSTTGLTLTDVYKECEALDATRSNSARRKIALDLLARASGEEARYIVKLLGGELRIGLKEAQVEDAIAAAFARPIESVRRANLLRGDIGGVALLARHGTESQAQLALFHPIGFMLAQPAETAEEIVETLGGEFALEDKYDGIRAQAHVGDGRVTLFSRTLDDITRGYPDVIDSLGRLPPGLVLDGELLAMDPDVPGRALPFNSLQRRLVRKAPPPDLLEEIPVAFMAYDVVAQDGQLTIEATYAQRRTMLEQLSWSDRAVLAPSRVGSSVDDIEAAFAKAREDGNEGLIAKALNSTYTPGRRGKTWLKLKRALATLDVVVTAVERGHGRRRDVLSDYTFAVRASEEDPTLLDVGKAYNGLTDAEILAMTERFKAITIEQLGRYHVVRPEVVIEVTFDIVQRSNRHAAGFALRFPRIVRVRDDKPVNEIDTLARVRELAGEA